MLVSVYFYNKLIGMSRAANISLYILAALLTPSPSETTPGAEETGRNLELGSKKGQVIY